MDAKYRRMVKRMNDQEAACPRSLEEEGWVLYILRCHNDAFYTGVTKDLGRRFKMHNNGKASRYTRAHRPVELVYYEGCASRSKALARECRVKSLSRKEKEQLVAQGPCGAGCV